MQHYSKWLRMLDLISGAASLAWGIWTGSREGLMSSIWPTVWLIGGIIGIAMFVINPAERVFGVMKSKFGRAQCHSKTDPGFPSPPLEPYRSAT